MHPTLFHWKSFTIYSYGFFVALAVLAGYAWASLKARSFGFSKESITDLVFFLFLFGIAGARAFYVIQHAEDYASEPWKIFWLQEGGLIWYGGFVAAGSFGFFYAAKKGWPVLALCDFFAPVLALAHAIGRIGCFLNGCCFGRETRCPIGVLFPGEALPRFPTQALESAGLVCIFLFLNHLLKRKHRNGEIFVSYLFCYSVLRFFIEFLRGDQVRFAQLTLPQWTSLILFAGAIVLRMRINRKKV